MPFTDAIEAHREALAACYAALTAALHPFDQKKTASGGPP